MFKKSFLFLVLMFLSLFVVLNLTSVLAADEEALGREAEQEGKLRQALKHYVSALQFESEGSSKDRQLREKIIRLAFKIQPPPMVPEEVIEYEGRAEAAVRFAKSPEGYLDAVKEYRKASLLSPWIASYYFNLGMVLEKAEKPDEAIRNFELYLLADPDSSSTREVRKKIAGLRFMIEKIKDEDEKFSHLLGWWQLKIVNNIPPQFGGGIGGYQWGDFFVDRKGNNFEGVEVIKRFKMMKDPIKDTSNPKKRLVLRGALRGEDLSEIRWEVKTDDPGSVADVCPPGKFGVWKPTYVSISEDRQRMRFKILSYIIDRQTGCPAGPSNQYILTRFGST